MAARETQTLGYPRIGRDRELKHALERYWRGDADKAALMATFWEVSEAGWQTQLEAGIEHIGVGSETLYDHVLDWAVRFGLVAERFADLSGLSQYFAMARGASGIPALEMTKWFDTNYHYLVPEIDPTVVPTAHFADFLTLVERAQGVLDERAVPIVLGPVTLLHLSRVMVDEEPIFETLLELYRQLLTGLSELGIDEVQIHEPVLVLDEAAALRDRVARAYEMLAESGVPLNLVTYFDDLGESYPWVMELPVHVISLDFTRGHTLDLLEAHGWPDDKVLGAGVIDGRSVWRVRPDEMGELLDKLHGVSDLRLGVSSSLQFVPYAASREQALPDPLRGVLAFAEEKLVELRDLGRGIRGDAEAWARFSTFSPEDEALQARMDGLTDEDFSRSMAYAERRLLQIELPRFPMTTIGSFPQTRDVRRLRAKFRRGEIDEAAYQAGVDAFIAYTIGVQDGLGFDVLVHGEFERSDMVEYFAQKMTGFAFTRYGWVQSFGSRCVRPPIIYGDVTRPEAMTVREFEVAQSFTDKPVKGMLTGPVTILNWSYPRTDIPRHEIARQIALALRDEVADLEKAGARVIQVDEPALREGLPLKEAEWQIYLMWAVDAFRLATANALPETQVHTHMCYSEFGDILEAIDRMDADVISIENARSDDATLRELAAYGYPREVGPGIYDIHSPVVPDVSFIVDKVQSFAAHLDPTQLWVNPDCGLKTRAWDEVIPSLQHIAEAVVQVRRELEPDPTVEPPA